MFNPVEDKQTQEAKGKMIQTNSYRGIYKKVLVDRIMDEIHDAMQTVFGPYAVDAWITKDDMPYYTRDGKEVFASMHTDDELCEYIGKILYQAAENQGRKVGDGTTTLFILYTNLYRNICRASSSRSRSLHDVRNTYKKLIEDVNAEMKKHKVALTNDMLKSMFYTCTQDAELSSMLYSKLHEAIMDEAYILVNKSNMETLFDVDVYMNPTIKVTRLYESRAMGIAKTISGASVFYVNGVLDIGDVNTLIGLASLSFNDGTRPAICILCSGTSHSTRQTLKDYDAVMRDPRNRNSTTNPIYIFSIDNYQSYTSEQIDDLVAYIYDVPEASGLTNELTFEAYLYQTFYGKTDGKWDNEALGNLDLAPEHVDTLKRAFMTLQGLEYDPVNGMKFSKPLGPVSQARYDELRRSIETEKSPIKRIELNKRLKKLYGKFIDVKIGSKLLKDSQRAYELVLDAIISSGDAVRYGVYPVNSIFLAIYACHALMVEMGPASSSDPLRRDLLFALTMALIETLADMIQNKDPNMAHDTAVSKIKKYFNDIFKDPEVVTDQLQFDLKRPDIDTIFDSTIGYPTIKTKDGDEISSLIVEPVTIMSNLLENSTMILEIANAKMFNLNSWTGNYMD